MNKKQILFKALVPAMFAAALLFNSSESFAQVKIGSNPTVINAANNLEVESADPTKKVSIDKTTGKVTIADGSQGAAKVLTSDASGVATWQTPASGKLVLGVMPDLQTNLVTLPGDGTLTYLGASITLPPGKWLINVSCYIGSSTTVGVINAQARLSTSQTSLVPPTSLSNPLYPGFITGQNVSYGNDFHNSGSPMVIEVASTTTLYVIGFVYANYGAPAGTNAFATMSRILSGTEYFYAQSLD